MYEHAGRVGEEQGGLRGVQRRAKSLLACLNALELGDPVYAWIERPVPPTGGGGAGREDGEGGERKLSRFQWKVSFLCAFDFYSLNFYC